MAIKEEIALLPESTLTITCDAISFGRYLELPMVTGESTQYPPVAIGPNQVITLGPFNTTKKYRIISTSGRITYQINFEGVGAVTSEAVIEALSSATLELVYPANNDEILIKDSSDGGKLKAITVQDLGDFLSVSAGTSSSLSNTINQASHGFSVGDVIAINSSGLYIKAISSSIVTSEVVGIVNTVDNVNEFTIVTSGRISGLSGLIAGCSYFVSDLTAGDLTTIPPYLPNTVEKAVLIADTATSGYVQNYLGVHND